MPSPTVTAKRDKAFSDDAHLIPALRTEIRDHWLKNRVTRNSNNTGPPAAAEQGTVDDLSIMAVQATARQDGELLIAIGRTMGEARMQTLGKAFRELVPKTVEHPHVTAFDRKYSFTFRRGRFDDDTSVKLAHALRFNKKRNLWGADIDGMRELRNAIFDVSRNGNIVVRSEVIVSDTAMSTVSRVFYNGYMNMSKDLAKHAKGLNSVCRDAIRFQAKAVLDNAAQADIDRITESDVAVADLWVVRRRLISRSKSEKRLANKLGKVSCVTKELGAKIGIENYISGCGMAYFEVGGKRALLTTAELDHATRTAWALSIAREAYTEDEDISGRIDWLYGIWDILGPVSHYVCDKVSTIAKETHLGVPCFSEEKMEKVKNGVSKFMRACGYRTYGKLMDCIDSVANHYDEEYIQAVDTHRDQRTKAKIGAFDRTQLYKALPVCSQSLPLGMADYFDKAVESSLDDECLNEAFLIAEQIIVQGAVLDGHKVNCERLPYAEFCKRASDYICEVYSIDKPSEDEYDEWLDDIFDDFSDITEAKKIGVKHILGFDTTGIANLETSVESMMKHLKNSAIPGPNLRSGVLRADEPTERVYSAWGLENISSYTSVLREAMGDWEAAVTGTTPKVEAQKVYPRLTFEGRPAFRMMLSLSEARIQSLCQHCAAFVPGKGGTELEKDLSEFTRRTDEEAAQNYKVYFSSDDVDAFSRSFTLEYLDRMSKFRAKIHGVKQYEMLTGFWRENLVVGKDVTGAYALDGLECDLEGMNGMLNTLLRVASIYSASRRIKTRVSDEIESNVWGGPIKVRANIDDALQRYTFKRELTTGESEVFLGIMIDTMKMYGITLSVGKLFWGMHYQVFLDKTYSNGVLIRSPVKASARVAEPQANYDLSIPERVAAIGAIFKPLAKAGASAARVYRIMVAHTLTDVVSMTGGKVSKSDSTAFTYPPSLGGLGMPWLHEFRMEGLGSGTKSMYTLAACRIHRERNTQAMEEEDEHMPFKTVAAATLKMTILTRSPASIARAPTSLNVMTDKAASAYTSRLIMDKVSFAHYNPTKHDKLVADFNAAVLDSLTGNVIHAAHLAAAYDACGLRAMDSALEKVRNSKVYSMVATRQERRAIQAIHKVDALRVRACHARMWDIDEKGFSIWTVLADAADDLDETTYGAFAE